MSELFESSEKPAVGGMAAFRKLAQRDEFQPNNENQSVWGNMWKARGRWSFKLEAGKDCSVVFISDIMVFPAYDVIFGWNKSGSSWPKSDVVRAPGWEITADGAVQTGEDPFSEIFLHRPRIVGVAKVFDSRPFTPKTGPSSPRNITHILIKQQTVLETLDLSTASAGRDLYLAKFAVRRSTGPKTANIGDSWFHQGYVDEAALDKDYSAWRDEAAAIDLARGYPVLSREESIEVIKQHVRVSNAHKGADSYLIKYDIDAYNRLVGKDNAVQDSGIRVEAGATVSDTAYDDIEDDSDFGDLDDIL